MNLEKRHYSLLLPCKRQGETIAVYLQKRSADAKGLPGYFGFWGGKFEDGETEETALAREVKEVRGGHLDITSVQLFTRYEFLRSVKYVYLLEVSDDWESRIVIGEGDYGKWFVLEEVFALDNLILEDKVILNDLERKLFDRPLR